MEHIFSVEAGGRQHRFGPYERGGALIDCDFDTELPGGFGPANVVVPEPANRPPLRQWLYASGRIHDEANRTLHEGRVVNVARAEGKLTFQLEGWSKALEDNEYARVLFLSRDLARWEAMTAERRVFLAAASHTAVDPEVGTSDSGVPAVKAILGSSDQEQNAEAWFDAGPGLRVAAIDYAWKRTAQIDNSDSNYEWRVGVGSDSAATPTDQTGNLRAAGPGAGTFNASTARRWAAARLLYNGSISNDRQRTLLWTLLCAIGDHDLPLQGTVAAPAEGRGILVGPMAAHVVSKFAPVLSFTEGAEGSIESGSFAVPHADFSDPGTAAAILETLSLFGGNSNRPLEWGVYEGREFFMRSAESLGRTWLISREGAVPADDGPDSKERLNGVIVTYQDGSGKQKSVGPPGSGADLETVDLRDDDPNNPANRDGSTHWRSQDAGITTQGGAIQVGQLILADANDIRWRGSIEVKGEARDSYGQRLPAALIRAGDRCIFEDDVDTRPRQVRGTSYDSATRTNSLTIGPEPGRLDVLLARAEVVLSGRLPA